MSELRRISYLDLNTINVCKADIEKIKKLFSENDIKASFHENGLEALCEIEAKFRVENNFVGTEEEAFKLTQDIEQRLKETENLLDYEIIDDLVNKWI